MHYFTRYFQDSLRPYHLLDFFEIYDEAEKYDNDFYIRLLNQRKKEFTKENTVSSDRIEQYIYSIQYTASAWTLLSTLPSDIVTKIVDIRVYLLYAITREVYESICKEKDKQEKIVKKVIEDYEHHKKIDLEKAPKHWKQIFDIDWMQALLVKIDDIGRDMRIRISTTGRDKYDITLRDIEIIYNETNVTSGVIYYAETLLNHNNLEINLLTNLNEISIIAKDVNVEKIL